MVTVWWSGAGVIHYNFLQQDQTITVESWNTPTEIFVKKFSYNAPGEFIFPITKIYFILNFYDNTVLNLSNQKLFKR